MKKLTASLIIITSLLIACDTNARKFPSTTDASRGPVSPESPASKLTEAEEADLQRLLPIILLFNKKWRSSIAECPEGNDTKRVNIAEIIKQREGQKVDLRLSIRENSLIIILDPLHMYLVFPRLHALGLAPPEERTFCEKTYEDSVATQKQYRYFEGSPKQVRGDPGLTAIVNRINQRYPSSDYDIASREEVREYMVPMLTPEPVQPYSTWGNEKKRLYERIVEVARHQAEFHCQPKKPVTMIVPDFAVGDPGIYLLFEGTTIPIEWIILSRNVSTGEYTAEHAKNFGLPDEIKVFSPLIKARQVRRVIVKCSG